FADFYKSHPQTTRPIVMYDSLLVEVVNVYTGLATNTVEFINGKSLFKGCWYVIKSKDTRKNLYRQVRHLQQSEEYFIDRDSKEAGVGILMAYPRHTELALSRILHDSIGDRLDDL